jgi:hypothetical protein
MTSLAAGIAVVFDGETARTNGPHAAMHSGRFSYSPEGAREGEAARPFPRIDS